ncbi:HTH-type transcriptional activator IlvY [Shewanella intestini]|uniref:HTH-type transcriptional activator IlvY n=1 Tax=Shewanella intestini TaxID=2017544 RepID=A0ABS5I2R0_9GAMM|nr:MULTISPECIES: HTH-type transcriptional activator IlvY [Shewanella]MBR9728181.1 HTH-type transcriptional activator IlvY [Shewanella intestini]MRG36652.1 HTH-type transcriptional activator IlvY [Shewanella sp. XMDDZSB0408]
MDIRTLTLYLQLCDSLHFAKTAQQSHMSPSTLSRTLQRLEQDVGCQLFERDNRSVTITPAGLEFKQFALKTLSNWSELQHNVGPDQALLSGRITLYCSVTAAYSHLPALLERFRREHPQVEITLSTGDAANAVNMVRQGHADIAISAYPDNFSSSLHFAHIDQVPLKIIAPNIHCQVQTMVNQAEINWQALPFILPEHGPGKRRAEQWFKQMAIKPTIYAYVSGQEAMTSMVALGCGVSITPEVVIQNSPVRDKVQTIPSPIEIPAFEIGCCCKEKRVSEPLISAFLQVI